MNLNWYKKISSKIFLVHLFFQCTVSVFPINKLQLDINHHACFLVTTERLELKQMGHKGFLNLLPLVNCKQFETRINGSLCKCVDNYWDISRELSEVKNQLIDHVTIIQSDHGALLKCGQADYVREVYPVISKLINSGRKLLLMVNSCFSGNFHLELGSLYRESERSKKFCYISNSTPNKLGYDLSSQLGTLQKSRSAADYSRKRWGSLMSDRLHSELGKSIISCADPLLREQCTEPYKVASELLKVIEPTIQKESIVKYSSYFKKVKDIYDFAQVALEIPDTLLNPLWELIRRYSTKVAEVKNNTISQATLCEMLQKKQPAPANILESVRLQYRDFCADRYTEILSVLEQEILKLLKVQVQKNNPSINCESNSDCKAMKEYFLSGLQALHLEEPSIQHINRLSTYWKRAVEHLQAMVLRREIKIANYQKGSIVLRSILGLAPDITDYNEVGDKIPSRMQVNYDGYDRFILNAPDSYSMSKLIEYWNSMEPGLNPLFSKAIVDPSNACERMPLKFEYRKIN